MIKDEMQETMDEIERQSAGDLVVKNKESLKKEIDDMKNEIKLTEERNQKLDDEAPSYAPITPEQANQNKKIVVLLKKALASLQARYQEML